VINKAHTPTLLFVVFVLIGVLPSAFLPVALLNLLSLALGCRCSAVRDKPALHTCPHKAHI
jgi:hypothetical protein